MHELDRVMEGLDEVGKLLDSPHLDPDPSRKNWDEQRQTISMIVARIETEVLGPFNYAVQALEEEQQRIQLRLNTAHLAAETAAVLHAAGRSDQASTMLRRALGF